jgi:hypothetical protein
MAGVGAVGLAVPRPPVNGIPSNADGIIVSDRRLEQVTEFMDQAENPLGFEDGDLL